MKNNVIINNKKITEKPCDLHKVITLLYLKDALCNEEYDGCLELIMKAREFGAHDEEISEVLAKFNHRAKGAKRNELRNRKKSKGRLRF